MMGEIDIPGLFGSRLVLPKPHVWHANKVKKCVCFLPHTCTLASTQHFSAPQSVAFDSFATPVASHTLVWQIEALIQTGPPDCVAYIITFGFLYGCIFLDILLYC